jgi:glycerophosphoryl diester phosphodiesterase
MPVIRVPALIAHRGYARQWPENTLVGIDAAVRAGACFVEFDVQLSRDGVPVLLHDDGLLRTAGRDARVGDLSLRELRQISVGEPARLGAGFADVAIAALRDAVTLLRACPGVGAFVEIKGESLERFGVEPVVKSVMAELKGSLAQCVPISFSTTALQCARSLGARAVGWVMDGWDEAARTAAAGLAPDFLFCDHERLPSGLLELWPGPWRWALYEVADPELALDLAARGADLVETMAIGEMLLHPLLRRRGCFPDPQHV